jgi:hypothetical protein
VTLAAHLLNRILRDPRLAYYFDPVTESMELLTAAYAAETGQDVEVVRREVEKFIRFEPPACKECGGAL